MLVAVLLAACHDEPFCSSQVVHVVRETGTDGYAVVEVRNCGATTDFVTTLRVGHARQAQSAAQEVFVADSNHGTAAPGMGDAIWINVAWVDRGRLNVAYASGARVFKMRPSADGVAVSYRAVGPVRR